MATDETRTFGEKLRALMEERGVSLRGLARTTHYDPGYLSKVANDKKRPSRQMVDDLEAALDAQGELAASASRRVATNPPITPRAGHGPTNGAVGTFTPSPAPDPGDDDVKRRAALQLLAALGAGAAIPPGTLETVLSGVEHALGADTPDLADWERAVHDYDHRINTSPAGSLIADLTADIIAMDAAFARRLPPLQHAGLLRVGSALSGLLAIELGDVGDVRAARIAWGTAARAADASGDQDLRVWARGRAAEDALFTGRSPRVVAELADEAIDVAGGKPSPGLACAYAARTYLAAMPGGHGLAAALAGLSRTFEGLPESTVAQSIFGFRETQYHWGESFAYVHTGDKRADAALATAADLYPANAYAPRANLELMRAIAQVKNREIEAGLQHALHTLHNNYRDSSGGRLLARSVLGALPPNTRALPAARELSALTTAPA